METISEQYIFPITLFLDPLSRFFSIVPPRKMFRKFLDLTKTTSLFTFAGLYWPFSTLQIEARTSFIKNELTWTRRHFINFLPISAATFLSHINKAPFVR